MEFMNEVERKQRVFNIYNGFTFEHTVDLSDTVIIHPPKEYTEVDLLLAITQFIGMFCVMTLHKLNGFNGFDSIKYVINE